jgi:hypothetical protein
MSKENKKPGEIKDEDLRGVSAGGLKEVTPIRERSKAKTETKPGLPSAPPKKK